MMTAKGLAKVLEECGELIQIAAKKLAYPHTDLHPDGSIMSTRMEEEMGDVRAAIEFVIETHNLNEDIITLRKEAKLNQYRIWHKEPA